MDYKVSAQLKMSLRLESIWKIISNLGDILQGLCLYYVQSIPPCLCNTLLTSLTIVTKLAHLTSLTSFISLSSKSV